MLNFFKRPAAGAEIPAAKPAARDKPPKTSKPASPPDPLPVPEVVEGNQDSDWSLWEDSVAFQDSQMPSDFGALKAPEVRESAKNKPADDHDPFGSVRRRAP
jgi:hypothetical protein